MADSYTKNQIDKLGNAIIFLCEKLLPYTQISKTHILKLVFILEEISVKRFGIPFFGLRFDVWKLGPVSKDLYIDLSGEPNLLSAFIDISNNADRSIISPKLPFSDDEFNDIEIQLMEDIAERFKYCTATELINFTHRKDSPWFVTAQRHGLVEILEAGETNATNIEIDLSELIKEDEAKLAIYRSHQEFLKQTKSLKS
ncbi:MAG TPA: Panacea domain-containing protein [Phnomibacter sp.]|nr:Panacea domain-containing protein [Phnomibacter sp.]